LMRARDRARVEAQKLAYSKELKDALATAAGERPLLQTLRDLARTKFGSQIIELRDDPSANRYEAVTRKTKEDTAVATAEKYRPYQLPATVPNAGPAFINDLLKLSPKDRVKVIPDDVQKMYYVAVLLDSKSVTPDQVLEVYRDGAPRGEKPRDDS